MTTQDAPNSSMSPEEFETFVNVVAVVAAALKPMMKDYRKEVWLANYWNDDPEGGEESANIALAAFDRAFTETE